MKGEVFLKRNDLFVLAPEQRSSLEKAINQESWISAINEVEDSKVGAKLQLKQYIYLAQKFLSDKSPKNEGNELERRRTGKMLADRIMRFKESDSLDLLLMVIKLYMNSKCYQDVIDLSLKLKEKDRNYTDDANEYAGIAYYYLNNMTQAFECLSKVSEAARGKKACEILSNESLVRQIGQARKDIKDCFSYREQGLHDKAKDSFIKAVISVYPDYKSKEMPCTIESLFNRKVELAHEDLAFPEKKYIAPIFCAGFEWSGASAIYDYLSQHSSVAKFWKQPRFMQDTQTSIEVVNNTLKNSPAEVEVKILKFIMEHMFGIDVLTSEPANYLSIFERAIYKQLRGLTDIKVVDRRLALFIKKLKAEARSKTVEKQFPVNEFSEYLQAMIYNLCSKDEKYVLFDSVIRSNRANLLELIDGAKMVVVMRDPRDMYVTHVERAGWDKGANKYIVKLKRLYDQFEKARSSLSIDNSIIVVRFEDFVFKQSERTSLLKWLSLKQDDFKKGKQAFNPEESVHNIGIYKDFKDQEAIKLIGKAFPEYCYKKPEFNNPINVLTFSVMGSKRQQQDKMHLSGKPGEPGWLKRREITANLLLKNKYDFFGLQHIHLDIDEKYNAVKYFHDKLAEQGLQYDVLNCTAGDNPQKGDSTPLFYRTDRWELDQKDHGVKLFSTKLPAKPEGSGGGRLFIYGLFHEKSSGGVKTGRGVYLYHTRLINKHNDILDVYRLFCLQELYTHISKRDNKTAPVIFLGDTNCKKYNCLADKYLMGHTFELGNLKIVPPVKMKDAFVEKYPDLHGRVSTQHNYNKPGSITGNERNARILFSSGLKVEKCEILTTNENGFYPSYHYPVEAELNY